MNKWMLLIISLTTDNATARMRAWRSLKTSGAALVDRCGRNTDSAA